MGQAKTLHSIIHKIYYSRHNLIYLPGQKKEDLKKEKQMIRKSIVIFVLLLAIHTAHSEECINLYNKSGESAVGQKVIDLELLYKSSLDIIDENQQGITDNNQSIIETIEEINERIEKLIEDISTNQEKKLITKATVEDLEQQIAALNLQILALNSELESLLVLYDDMLNNEKLDIQVQIGTIWDLQIKKDSFPYKSRRITKQGGLGGLFDFLGDFDAIFGGAANFDAAFSILFDILLDFAGGERSGRIKKLRKSMSKELFKIIKRKRRTLRTNIINKPGIYRLSKGINSGITINSDNVILDLDNNTIASDTTAPITIACNKKNILIKNGALMGGDNYIEAPAGIKVHKGAQLILVDNIDISFCHKAIHLQGTQRAPVTYCKVKNCIFDSNLIAIALDFATHNIFDYCKIYDSFEKTIEEHNSNENHLKNIVEL